MTEIRSPGLTLLCDLEHITKILAVKKIVPAVIMLSFQHCLPPSLLLAQVLRGQGRLPGGAQERGGAELPGERGPPVGVKQLVDRAQDDGGLLLQAKQGGKRRLRRHHHAGGPAGKVSVVLDLDLVLVLVFLQVHARKKFKNTIRCTLDYLHD